MTTTRQLADDLYLDVAVVGPMSNNAYLLREASGRALLVDAADDAPALLDLVSGVTVETIVTTHRHHDHVQALAELAAATGARTVAGRPDAQAIEQATGVACEPLWTGDSLTLGRRTISVVGLVGHTPGSIALVVDAGEAGVQLFTGDSLFPGGVGKTGSAEDFTSLLDDVERELFARHGDDAVVWPGHGDHTTLGAERPHLAEWRERGW
ncbi:MBL fold metallo-hydrolase [Luteococcus peritonei]|uniref:MBL fold metallo-hydrolase n=1 Tax=Luteococcus peritonei TaxID=88874 RepID=A0ABW4RRI1_9ACTN